MSRLLKNVLMIIVVVIAIGAGLVFYIKNQVRSTMESALPQFPAIKDKIGDVSSMSVALSEYTAQCTTPGCERYVARITGTKGVALLAADVDVVEKSVTSVAVCSENGELIANMDAAPMASEGHCR